MTMKALLVGVNRYPDPTSNLRGCINDVLQTSKVLQQSFGFSDAAQIRMLTDARATTAAIVCRLKWLVAGARPGDVLVFHYSGHGSQVRDREGDELDDGLDEIICPYDLDWDDPFTDDDMSEILGGLRAGVNCTILLDCCHSGTGLRDVRPNGVYRQSRCLAPPPDIHHRVQPVIVDLGEHRRFAMGQPKLELALRRFGQKAAERGAVLLAACRADQSCADAFIDGDYHGAFTYFLWKAATSRQFKLSYRQLVTETAEELSRAGYEQVPQLEGPASMLGQNLLASLAVSVG